MPIVAALPAVAGALGAASAAKGLLSNSGGSPTMGNGPVNIVGAEGAAKRYSGVEDSLANQQAFLTALQGQNGIANQSSVFNQLNNVAAGQGPNPAQAMLNQATGANAAQTSAQIGSARGISQNAGMAARIAANAGAGIQQQAVGQGATMQANQSLGALGQMGGIAGQQVGNQMAAGQQLTAAQQASYQQLIDQIKSQNQINAGLQENVNSGNVAEANSARDMAGKVGGGLLQGAAGAAGMIKPEPQSNAPLAGMTGPPTELHAAGGEVGQGPRSHFGRMVMAKGGMVPAKVSPGEIYLPPDKARAVAAGRASPMSGQRIKGKAKVGGDSYANDTVKKNLQEGGVVIPRSKAMGDDITEKATAFVRAVLARGRHA